MLLPLLGQGPENFRKNSHFPRFSPILSKHVYAYDDDVQILKMTCVFSHKNARLFLIQKLPAKVSGPLASINLRRQSNNFQNLPENSRENGKISSSLPSPSPTHRSQQSDARMDRAKMKLTSGQICFERCLQIIEKESHNTSHESNPNSNFGPTFSCFKVHSSIHKKSGTLRHFLHLTQDLIKRLYWKAVNVTDTDNHW